ncbi:MAG TPA: response regulator, partial [Polyangiaceae bacterium]|nr:response regulator [Polyangiaceae bacterium]
ILLIDDDDLTREIFATTLREAGYVVFELPSPIGASRTIMNEQIEVVVLDMYMPQLNGDKFAKMLRNTPRLERIAIVLVSSCDPAELAETARRVRADAVVPKADAATQLVPTIRRIANRMRNRRT